MKKQKTLIKNKEQPVRKTSPKKAWKVRSSEFRAYPWIEKYLRLKGWNTSNPNVNSKGEVWTQQECLDDPNIRLALITKRPENVVRISANEFWLIEAKHGKSNIDLACKEAQQYADLINEKSKSFAPIASGVAGDEETGFLIKHFIKINSKWHPIMSGSRHVEGFLSKTEILRLISQKTSNLVRDDLTQKELVTLANFINDQLHLAKITKESRSIVVAQLLLALHEDPSLTMKDPIIFLQDISSRAERIFSSAGKRELWQEVKIGFTAEKAAPVASALSRIVEELKLADIVDAAGNADVLGPFFESFLRYGNTSQDLGIVLTPRHICWLAAEALGIHADDVIYDPAAGTAGFLVAAFNRIQTLVDKKKSRRFAEANIYGAETDAKVAALAFINMYFRGDGKHNLSFQSCFDKNLIKNGAQLKFVNGSQETNPKKLGITKVLMNPPFSLKDSKEKEPDFIDHALRQMIDGGLLFCIVPASVFYERKHDVWRRRLLEGNTLLASVTFPVDLFYPVATQTIAVILKKGVPHQEANVLWAHIDDDGFEKKKGYRVEKSSSSYKEALGTLAESIREWTLAGRKLHTAIGKIEFLPITNRNELIPQAHLGTGKLSDESFTAAVNQLMKGMISQQWEQLETKGGQI